MDYQYITVRSENGQIVVLPVKDADTLTKSLDGRGALKSGDVVYEVSRKFKVVPQPPLGLEEDEPQEAKA